MPQGKITKLVSDRGFGFIAGERGEVFFHHSSVADAGFDNLQEGQSVQVRAGKRRRRPRQGAAPPRSNLPDAHAAKISSAGTLARPTPHAHLIVWAPQYVCAPQGVLGALAGAIDADCLAGP